MFLVSDRGDVHPVSLYILAFKNAFLKKKLCSLITINVAHLNLNGKDTAKPASNHSSRCAGTIAEDTGRAVQLYPRMGKGTWTENCTQLRCLPTKKKKKKKRQAYLGE